MKFLKLLLYPFLAGALCFAAYAMFTHVVERNVVRDAERQSVAWAEFATVRLTRIEALAAGAMPNAADVRLIEQMAQFGQVFRFNLFTRDGRLVFTSDAPEAGGTDLGEHNPTAAGVMKSLQPYTKVADGTGRPDRPDLYSETYLPIVRDGELVAIVEVYVDQTATSAAVRADYATLGIGIALLTLLAVAGPTAALVLVLRKLRHQNVRFEEARLRAEDADRGKTEFLANVSHELRTPMNGVLGASQVLASQSLDEDGREMLMVLTASANEQIALVNDLIDVTRLDTGEMKLEYEPFDPAATVRELACLLQPNALQADLELRCDAQAVGMLLGDEAAFRRICSNLVVNAIKYTEAGLVSVTLRSEVDRDTAMVCLDIADTGIGISDDHLPRICERFVQVDGSISRRATGMGLGLWITRSLVRLHGGAISVESRLGEGSVFTVRIPMLVVESGSGRIAA